MFPQESFRKIVDIILIDYKFEFPTTLAMIGVNGAYMVARFELSGTAVKTIALTGKAKNLRFPINTMFVDARGKAAHVLFKKSVKDGDLTLYDVWPETPPVGWPKA